MAEKDKKSLLEEAKANYKIADEWFGHNRKAWLEDARFRAGDQWPEKIKRDREAEGLPCLVVDKLNQYVRQVVNDGRQNRPAVKVRPIDDGADIKVAEGLQGLIRSICNRSNADDAFDTALDHAAGNGFGYIRVVTEYAHEKTFNQDIAVRRVRNPVAVLLGPHQQADGSDAMFGFAIDEILKTEFKKRYPKAKVTDWTLSDFHEGWATDDKVKVCEYFYKVEEPATLLLLEDGTTALQEEYEQAVSEGVTVPGIKESREISVCKVKWCRLSGAEILEENKWLGKHIPIIPVYGNESDIEGKVTYSGLIRAARDAQVLHNFSRTAFAQRVALTPKAPWLAPNEAIEGYQEWEEANVGKFQVLRYNATGANGEQLPQPSRINPTDIPAGFAQDMQLAEHDIQGALGMYNASLGEKSNEKSGRAIMARQREGDTATFHYQDNLNRAIRHLGRILVDLAPKIYDGTRLIRLLGEDGTTTEAMVDPRQEMAHQTQKTPDGKERSIYNLGVGIYDVDVSTGPSYTTKRQEAAEAMLQLAQANPTMWQTHGDLMVKEMDWNNADKFAQRSKMALPPPIAQAVNAEEHGDQQSPEVLAMQRQLQQMNQALQQAGAQIQQLSQQVEQKQADTHVKMLDAQTKQYQAETERMQALAPAITPESIAAIVQQTVSEIMRQPAPPPDQMQPQQPPSGGFFTPGV